MDLTNIDVIKRLCHQYRITPDPDSGQNFLVSREVLARTVEAAALSPQDTVVEVGPGFGTLTKELAQRARHVIAIELDPKLLAAAKEILAPYKNIELIQGNFLNPPSDFYKKISVRDPSAGLGMTEAVTHKIVANLPYGITGRFFRRVFSLTSRPDVVVVMVQQEVAERILAQPGRMSLIAVLCQLHAEVREVVRVPRDDFWPAPEVDSAVVSLAVRSPAELSDLFERHNPSYPPLAPRRGSGVTPEEVMRVAKIGFVARRKTLANNLRAVYLSSPPPLKGRKETEQERRLPQEKFSTTEVLTALGLSEKCRAQELSVEQWITLAKMVKF